MKKTSRFLFVLMLMCALFLSICVVAFAGTLTLPASLTTIGPEAFKGDASLDKVIIPSGVTEIPRAAFAGSSLKTIYLPDSVTRIADDAFAGTYPLYVETPSGNYTLAEIAAGSAKATIDNGGDYVKFRFKPDVSGSYTLSSTGSGDTVCYLYDAAGNLLASDDDGGEGLNFSLTYTLTAGSLYYYRVQYYSSSATGSIPLTLSAPYVPTARYRALCVGNENYVNASHTPGCINDMNSMAGMLRGLSNRFTATTLSDATAAQIRSAISSVLGSATENDVSLFFYAGHGFSAEDDRYLGALVGINYGSSAQDDYITTADLAAQLSKVPGRVIVVLDSCHSGATIAGRSTGDALDSFNQSVIDAFAAYDDVVVVNDPNARTGELRKSKFVVITATKPTESSQSGYVGDIAVGAFSFYFIYGCGSTYPDGQYIGSLPADVNGDLCLTVLEVYNYAYAGAVDYNPDQHAMYYAADSNEILFRRN